MSQSPAKPSTVGILGGGVAGMSCALWLSQLGHKAVLIERNGVLGGQLCTINRENRWVLGLPGLTSAELAKRYAEHIRKTSVEVCLNCYPSAIETRADGYRIEIKHASNTANWAVRALVIATGARALGIETFQHLPGFAAAREAGLMGGYPLDHLDWLATLNGQRIAVVGAGDNALCTIKDAALAGARVHWLMRSPPKAQAPLLKEIAVLSSEDRIMRHENTVLAGFKRQQNGLALALSTPHQATQWLVVDRLFIRIGFAANSAFLDAFPACSGLHKPQGYIMTDTAKRTNLAKLYAIGDVANSSHPSVVAALADGALAAQTFAQDG